MTQTSQVRVSPAAIRITSTKEKRISMGSNPQPKPRRHFLIAHLTPPPRSHPRLSAARCSLLTEVDPHTDTVMQLWRYASTLRLTVARAKLLNARLTSSFNKQHFLSVNQCLRTRI